MQVYDNPEQASPATVVIGLDNLEAEPESSRLRGLLIHTVDVPSAQFRITQLTDPSGNTVVLAETLQHRLAVRRSWG